MPNIYNGIHREGYVPLVSRIGGHKQGKGWLGWLVDISCRNGSAGRRLVFWRAVLLHSVVLSNETWFKVESSDLHTFGQKGCANLTICL